MKKLYIVLFVLFSIPVAAQYSYNIKTNEKEIIFETITAPDNVQYDAVSFPENWYYGDPGQPRLPMKQLRYVLPEDVDITGMEINEGTATSLNGSYYLYPVQEEVPMHEEAEFATPDELIYKSTHTFPGNFGEIVLDEYYQGYHIVTINIYPLQYVPAKQQLVLYKDISFSFSNSPATYTPQGIQSLWRHNIIKSSIKSIVENPDDVDLYSGGIQVVVDNGNQSNATRAMPAYEGAVPDYIIITSNEADNGGVKTEFERFAQWKNKKGVPTQVVYTEDIQQNYQGVDLAEKIHNYLQHMRIKWGPGLFVLLGGDVNIIPARYPIDENGTRKVSDLYYCDVYKEGISNYNWNADGNEIFSNGGVVDLSPDNFIGRAPVEDNTEATVFVNKVINYENLVNVSQLNYVNDILLIGAHINIASNDPEIKDFCGQSWMNHAYSILPDNIKNSTWKIYDDYNDTQVINGDTIYIDGDEELTRFAVLNALNYGGSSGLGHFHLIAHLDHGNPYKIGASDKYKGQSLSMSDVGGLNNDNYLQIMYTGACNPNEFQRDCFSERYMNNPTGGGVAIIANTAHGYTNYSAQCITLFKSIYNYNGVYPYGYILGNCFALSRDATYSINANLRLNLLGDPEMPIWNKTPSEMNLISSSFNSSTQQVDATVGGLYIGDIVRFAVYKEDEVLCFKTDTATGSQLNFTIINVNPHTSGSLYITATAQNYIPLQDSIQVNITGKHLYTTSRFFDDDSNGQSTGNNDSLPDAGETIEMAVSLKNSGTEQAQNISAILSCITDSSSNYLTITEDSATFPDIGVGEIQASSTPYVFTLSNDIGETKRLHFQLDITADGSYSTTHDFYFDAYMSEVLATNKYVLSGDFTPGETVTFNIELSNKGNAALSGLTASISTTDSDVASYDNTVHAYPDIEEYGKDTAQTPYSFTISSNYTTGNPIVFNIIAENAYGKTWTDDFDIQDLPSNIENVKSVGSEFSIYLEWDPLNISTINGYNIYRSPSDANGNDLNQYEKLNIVPLTSSCFTDDGLDALTIYYYKIAAVSLSGIEGNRTCKKSWTSWPQATNWPVAISLEEYVSTGAVQVVDINGDGQKELFMHKRGFATEGALLGFFSHGEEVYDMDNNNTSQDPMLRWENEDARATPAIADINGDGILDVVSITGWESGNSTLTAYSLPNTEGVLPQEIFEVSLPTTRFFREPVLADLDNNGTKEIMIKKAWGQGFYIYSSTGALLYTDTNIGATMGRIAVADLDGNGYKEIVLGSNNSSNPNGVYMYSYTGSQWVQSCLMSNSSRTFHCSPTIADLDGNGTKEVIVSSNNGTTTFVNILNMNGSYWGSWNDNSKSLAFIPTGDVLPEVVVGDVDNDYSLEIIGLGTSELKIWECNGNLQLQKTFSGFSISDACPVLGDVDGDEEIEIIFPDGEYLNAINPTDGSLVLGFPLALLIGSTNHNASIGDIDNDGYNEVMINEGASAYVWETIGKSSRNEWPLIRSRSDNTAEYDDFCKHTNIDEHINVDRTIQSCRINSDIIVDNGTTLTIGENAEIFIQPDVEIIVNGNLIIENGASLTSKCTSKWKGKLIAQNGGNIIFKENTSIEMGELGSISIFESSSLSIYPNTNISLLDDNTMLEIAGDLHIASNTTFTFTGDGYIKFSNPGDDNTQNITCGSGASIFLQGSGRNDKIIEVQQNSVRFPAELVNLELRDGKIEMGSNKRMLKEVISGALSHELTLNNIKITSDNNSYNGHRGFVLWGQPNVTITNCEFEFGKYGLSNHVYWGQSLTVNNSEFNNNETGLHTYDKGISLSRCDFNNNTNYGLRAENMSCSSSISYCNFNENGDGVYYNGSASADLDIEKTIFDDNQGNGLRINGGFDTYISCTHIYDNTNGVYNQGSKLHLNEGDINTFSENSKSIYINTGYLYLNNAHNQLTPENGGFSVYGYISSRTGCNTPGNINCTGNRWFVSPAGQSPSFGNNYRTYISGCYPKVKIYLTDNSPYGYNIMCGIENPIEIEFGQTNVLCSPLLVSGNTGDLSLSEQIALLNQTMNEELTLNDYVDLFEDYVEIIEITIGSPISEVHEIQIEAWGKLHDILDRYFTLIQRDHTNQSYNLLINKLIDLNNDLVLDIECTQEEIVEYKLDNALLNRIRKEFELSITQLEALQIETDAMPLQNLEINSWLCHISSEKLSYEGIISPDEFQLSIQECNTFYENEFEQIMNDLFNDEELLEDTEISILDISPNPNTGNFTINLKNVVSGSQMQIVNVYSQPIADETIELDGNVSFNFNGFASGFYTVYYLENGIVVDSEGIVVE